jgi:hypothetical protein
MPSRCELARHEWAPGAARHSPRRIPRRNASDVGLGRRSCVRHRARPGGRSRRLHDQAVQFCRGHGARLGADSGPPVSAGWLGVGHIGVSTNRQTHGGASSSSSPAHASSTAVWTFLTVSAAVPRSERSAASVAPSTPRLALPFPGSDRAPRRPDDPRHAVIRSRASSRRAASGLAPWAAKASVRPTLGADRLLRRSPGPGIPSPPEPSPRGTRSPPPRRGPRVRGRR